MGTGKIIQADKIQGLADVPNFLSNPNGLLNTSGWTEGSYTAGAKPTGNFTASSGAGKFSISRTTTNPLGMTGTSLVFTKAAGDQRGRAVETIFALPLDYRAKVLKLSASYINTSTNATDFVAGSDTTVSDMIFYTAYSTDGGTTYTVAEPSSFKLLSNSKDNSSPYDGTYQTPYNATHLKLIAYVATTSATAWSIKAVLGVSPSQYVYGTPITDWQSYTPTIVGGAGSIVAALTGKRRRVGDTEEYQITYQYISGTGSSSELQISIANTIDTTKTDTYSTYGSGYYYSNVTGFKGTEVRPASSNSVQFTMDSSAYITGIIADELGSIISVNFSVPILGWSSSTQVSDGYDGRVVAASYWGASNTSINASSEETLIYANKYLDTVAAYNSSTGLYEVKTSGQYRITASAATNDGGGTAVRQLRIYRNNTLIAFGGIDNGVAGVTNKHLVSVIENFVAGETIKISYNNGYSGGVASISDNTANTLSIEKLSGSPTISAMNRVAFRYENASGLSIANGTTPTKVTGWSTSNKFDDTGSFNPTTGTLTAPAAGLYRIGAMFLFNSTTFTAGGSCKALIYVDNVEKASIDFEEIKTTGSQYVKLSGSDSVYLLAGQVLDIRLKHDETTARSLIPTGFYNYINIELVK